MDKKPRAWRRVVHLACGCVAPAMLASWILITVSAEEYSGTKGAGAYEAKIELNRPWIGALSSIKKARWQTRVLDPAKLYTLSVSMTRAPLRSGDRCMFSLEGPDGLQLSKTFHAGDPSLFLTFRPRKAGPVEFHWEADRQSSGRQMSPQPAGDSSPIIRILLQEMEVSGESQAGFEAEPNDSWQEANPLVLGRTVYGGCDDVEYLDNQREYQVGWDWFRIDFDQPESRLVFFELDLPDRDIPLQLLFYRYDPASKSIEPYTRGKDPMEVLHDGQKVRYSKFITRVLTKGRYYLAVLGNHPFYQLRTTLYPVPPYQDPRQAVETAMHYILGIGDAWFAQVPRLGARYRRSVMMHDEATRCTACHPTVFPMESNLTAFQQGYPVRAKSQFQYLMNRVYNAPTPLYGNPGANWVRFVAIQLQFFGKQGGLVIDYENSVTKQPTPLLRRYTGFLRAAWDHRETLPADENNGVSPIDSKFGFAWRDWRVLSEMARRTGDLSARASADHIEAIVASPDSSKRLEGTQDRLHRLYGLALMNRKRYSPEIAEAVRYILDLQNQDGGWPGNDEKSADGEKPIRSIESVEYLTGQAIFTLLKAGVGEKERAKLEKGARFLLSRQQPFGGWFQTETIENFVTPLRETRYAVMALATLCPRNPQPPAGLGNRDGKPAHMPRSDSVLHILDDLDNLWEVPDTRRAEFVSRISRLLEHENSWVRVLAAQCLGRIGDQRAVKPLLARLDDPDKMVWQSAAWALRQLGNRGLGVEGIRASLASPNFGTRRGAARVFAYQFYGMDESPDLLEAFFPLLADSDLLTRLQAVSTLSQWWYRTVDRDVRRRIFQAFIDRLADSSEDPIQRFNLSQALYILLDENLGAPGTGYGRWIDYLKPEEQAALRRERRFQEQEILLKPILRVLVEGPPQQRMGVLLGFDGTPFSRGYTTASFGPGNDREFGFEQGHDFEKLGAAFSAALSRQDQAQELAYGLRLGAFFDVFRGENARRVVPLYLNLLSHPDAAVREAAMEIADRVSLMGIGEKELDRLVRSSSRQLSNGPETQGTPEALMATLKLLRSHPDLLERKALAAIVREAVEEPDTYSIAIPLMASPVFNDQEAQSALLKAWPVLSQEADQEEKTHRDLREQNGLLSKEALERLRRGETVQPPQAFLDCLELLERRPSLLNQPTVFWKLAGSVQADNGRVRQLVFELLARHHEERNDKWIAPLVRDALLDNRAEVRRAALTLANRSHEVWQFRTVQEAFLQLLVDGDAQVRKMALDLVQRKKLISLEPRLLGRVKALEMGETDVAVRQQAAEVLRQAGLDPASVRPTAELSRPAVPDFDAFRLDVNPYFYKESAKDDRCCANCHATHRIFRLAEPPAGGQTLPEQALRQNYHSLLKVVDIYDPESSLVLRKPRSPSGQGGEDATSPTGLTHVGGTRWSDTDDPAYQAILKWIRAAAHPKVATPSAPE